MLAYADPTYFLRLYQRSPEGWWHRPDNPPTSFPVAVGEQVAPSVNRGRWIIECPYTTEVDGLRVPCAGAQLAAANQEVFFCVDCGMEDIGGMSATVTWPDTDGITLALSRRPAANANWRDDETVNDLWADNVNQGVAADADIPAGHKLAVRAIRRRRWARFLIELGVVMWSRDPDGTLNVWRVVDDPGVDSIVARLPARVRTAIAGLPTTPGGGEPPLPPDAGGS